MARQRNIVPDRMPSQGRSPYQRWYGARCVMLALGVLAVLAAACGGGGDDVADIVKTATAVATTKPSPTPTPDAVAAYRTRVVEVSDRLRDRTTTLTTDMLAAAETQGDPKWPGVLTGDADLLAAAAAEAQALAPPTEAYRAFASKLNTAAATLGQGAATMKQAVQRADATLGGQAFELLANGTTQLQEAMSALPPG